MIGQTLGHYRILEVIGSGGMGEVYRARDQRLDRDVALKVLPEGTLADETTRKRFHREAQALARLNHANIGAVYDFDTHNGVDFLVMEYIPGTSLAERMAHAALSEKEVAKLGAQIAAALQEAHEQGVIHRDLKPGNILITPKSQVKVLDFGLAKMLRDPHEGLVVEESLTQPQTAVGTLPYMTPEQLRGETVDARTDLFSLGTVLYEMSTGRRPFVDTLSPRLIDSIMNRIPAPPRAINEKLSPEMERIVLKCLEKDPENRYQSAKELEIDLRRFVSPTSTLAATVPIAVPRGLRRARTVALVSSALVIVAALLLALDVGGWRSRLLGRPRGPVLRSLAVLPLENLSGDAKQDYFVDGMTEAIITELSRIRSLKVISRTSAMRYKGARRPLPEIAKELGVDAIVEGSVLRVGNRVRISAQLIHASTDTNLWADNFDSELKDILKLQSDIARSVAEQIQTVMTPTEWARFAEARPVDPEAYDDYLRGRADFYRYDTAGLKEATVWYEKALARDANFPQAYAGLALVYAGYHNLGASTDGSLLDKAESLAREAIRRRPSLAEGHFALGFTLSMGGNWIPAREAYVQALALEPNHAHAHSGLGYIYENTGFLDQAEEESQRAQLLDPQLGPPYWHLTNVYHARGDHRRALAVLEDSPVRNWGLSSWMRARELFELGQLEKLQAMIPEGKKLGWNPGSTAIVESLLDYRAGHVDAARKRVTSTIKLDVTNTPRSAGLVASVLAVGGDSKLSLLWLEEAVKRGYANYPLLATGAEYAKLRGDLQFQKLLAEVKARHDQCQAAWK